MLESALLWVLSRSVLLFFKVVLIMEVLLSLINLSYLSAGNVRESSGNCFKADFFWNESIYLLPDLAFHCNSSFLLSFAGELLE